MKTIRINLDEEEEQIYYSYASHRSVDLEVLFKVALREKIENEIDNLIAEEYEERLKYNEVEFYSLEEVKKHLGL